MLVPESKAFFNISLSSAEASDSDAEPTVEYDENAAFRKSFVL